MTEDYGNRGGAVRLQGATDMGSAPTTVRTHFTIGEIAREFGFTLRALRFYEEKGLIRPRRTGNRRLYSAADRQRLEIIAKCKKVGMPLDDIRDILGVGNDVANDPARSERMLDKMLTRLDALTEEKARIHDYTQEALLLIADLKAKLGRAA
ncbi:DNA-binding transcriptional MerR regulator [Tepidamorphus gemmatus]|uniref:DNA-binding transcriptional MerR regulator n=2 Tax=Tepidamorphus gemmatus TaxID=747076 RepID=A0A4R3MHZ0_9HYPH|nr:MerR family transcriptional regulator [Tepidamorphus gemmatus]TCT13471.1 DNA-binding transcriptional MerR regulator [Tepidamorphus gemmatus]